MHLAFPSYLQSYIPSIMRDTFPRNPHTAESIIYNDKTKKYAFKIDALHLAQIG